MPAQPTDDQNAPKRILTGIQSSGRQHLGNILGAIEPALEMSAAVDAPSFFFIADFHSLTSLKDAKKRQENVFHTALAWLACGLDTDKDVFYRQSRIPEVAELTWYLNCFTPFPMLANAHSFKDKQENLADVNAGLFTYPVLMAADILLYDAEVVPVGKDQKQHLEMTRDIAGAFNRLTDTITLKLPEGAYRETVMTVPGIDGRKMSKSYGNDINIFIPDKPLRKRIMSIVTSSEPLEAPKNPDKCNVFALYKLIATPDQTAELRKLYLGGNFGYGHAKQMLFERIIDKYHTERARYFELQDNPDHVEALLEQGEARAREIALPVLERVRKALGYR
ncbi:MAG: tryptophan--tRNA ligase [Bacteroidota bacterium]